jgi:hypothetical protein
MTFYLSAYEKKFVSLTSVISAIPWQYIYIHMHWNAISITILRFSTVEMGRCRDGADSAEPLKSSLSTVW